MIAASEWPQGGNIMATHVATQQTEVPVHVKETVPLWLAVAITVVVSLPFGLYLGDYKIPLFVSFVVWAEYFALGAAPEALKTIVPAYIAGVVLTGVSMFFVAWLPQFTPLTTNGALAVSLFVFVGFMVYIMKFFPVLGKGSLPYFNGISMLLAVYFTASYPHASTWDPLVQPFIAAGWAIVAGLLGCLLGWFNVTITFPHKVPDLPKESTNV
jgi:hypothetical protein